MAHILHAAIGSFVSAHPGADIVEAVVDSTVHGPCLNLWAWRIQHGRQLEMAMQQVAASGDWGFFSDIVDELGSSTFEIALADIYPHWPDAIEQGDEALIRVLRAAAVGLPATTRLLFHHVDVWPAVEL